MVYRLTEGTLEWMQSLKFFRVVELAFSYFWGFTYIFNFLKFFDG